MKLIKKTILYLIQGKQEKVYEIDLCEVGENQYLVNFRYGRLNTHLTEGTKTTFPKSQVAAEGIFEKLVAERKGKGYLESLEEAREKTKVVIEEKIEVKEAKSFSDNVMGERQRHLLMQLEDYLKEAKDGPKKESQKKPTPPPRPSSPPKKGGLLSRIFSSAKRQGPTPPKTQGRFSKPLQAQASNRTEQLKGKRPLNRLIWRIGELRIKEAVPKLLALPKTQNKLDHYILAWALGRCGDNSALPFVEDLATGRNASAHLKSIAKEAMMALKSEKEQKEYSLLIIDDLPLNFKKILMTDDPVLLKRALNQIEKNVSQYEVVSNLYLISNVFPFIREGLIQWMKDMPLTQTGEFQSVRQLYKAAEFKDDSELFGLLDKKIVKSAPGFSSKRDWAYRNGHRYGMSKKTKNYLQRRTWRTLKSKGDAGDLAYVKMALGILLAYVDEDAVAPRSETIWNRQGIGYNNRLIINYTIFSPYSTFSQILFKNSNQQEINKSRSAWIYKRNFNHESPVSDQREEAFPELWDQLPQGIMHLLAESKCRAVQEMAIKAAVANIDQIADLSSSDFLALLLQNEYLKINELGLELAKKCYNPNEPDLDLVATLFSSNLPAARTLGMQWVDEKREFFFSESDFIMQLLFTVHEEVQDWLETAFKETPIPEAKQERLIARSIAKMMAYDAETSEQEKIAILQAGKILTTNFPEPLSSINAASIQDLLSHSLLEVKVFGARILVIHETPAEELPEEFILDLINGELPEMREVGVQLLGKLSDKDLVEKQLLLSELAVSEHPEIRKEVSIIIDRIAQKEESFGVSIVQKLAPHLLKKETAEGRDADLLDLLQNKLKSHLPSIDIPLRLKLLNSRRPAATQLGFYLLEQQTNTEDLTMRQIVRLGSAEQIDIRQWVWNYYQNNVSRIKYEREEAVRILDSRWEDTRDFNFSFFREHFTQEDWSPEVLVSVCDSVNPPVQNFGKELITKFFQEENGEQYLLQLSQHPEGNLQMFATNYLERYATDQTANLAELENYFTTVLSSINKSRVAKDRIFAFLHKEGMKSKEAAEIVARIIGRESATIAIGDKAKSIAIMRDLISVYGDLGLPMKVKEFEVWEG